MYTRISSPKVAHWTHFGKFMCHTIVKGGDQISLQGPASESSATILSQPAGGYWAGHGVLAQQCLSPMLYRDDLTAAEVRAFS